MIHKPINFYIHAGYPKTGTTFLQRKFFLNHPQIFYLGKESPSIDKNKTVDKVIDELRLISNEDFILRKDKYKKDLQSIIGPIQKDKKYVYSNEIFLNQIFCYRFDQTILLERFADILELLGFNIKFIFVQREVTDLILSLFSEAPHHFKRFNNDWISFKKFRNALIADERDHKTQQFLKSLNVKYQIKANKYLKTNFKEDLLLLSFNDLKLNNEHFLTLLSDFMELDCKYIEIATREKPLNTSLKENNTYYLKNYHFSPLEWIASKIPSFIKDNAPLSLRHKFSALNRKVNKFIRINKIFQSNLSHDKKNSLTFNEDERANIKKYFENDLE